MGGNIVGISKRGFFRVTAYGAAAVAGGAACNYGPRSSAQFDAAIKDAAARVDAARVIGQDAGSPAVGLQNGESIAMQFAPAPSGIYADGDRVWVASSRTNDPRYPTLTCGLFRFGLTTGDVVDSVELSNQNLGSVAALPDGSPVVGKLNGFYHGATSYEFPSDLRAGDALLPGASIITENGLGDHTLWFSVSRFDGVRYNEGEDPYVGAALLAYPVNSSSIDVGGVRQISTTGKNPTSFGLGSDDRLYVLNSGTYSWFDQPRPSIDIVDAAQVQFIESLPLPSLHGVTLQTSAQLAIGGNNHAYIGTADGSDRVLKVDLNTGAVVREGIVAAQGFHTGVVLGGGYVFATSYHLDRALVSALDAGSLAQVDVIDLEGVQAGPIGAATRYEEGALLAASGSIVSVQPNVG